MNVFAERKPGTNGQLAGQPVSSQAERNVSSGKTFEKTELQRLVDTSPKVKQLQAYQVMADQSTSQVVQRKEMNHEPVIQLNNYYFSQKQEKGMEFNEAKLVNNKLTPGNFKKILPKLGSGDIIQIQAHGQYIGIENDRAANKILWNRGDVGIEALSGSDFANDLLANDLGKSGESVNIDLVSCFGAGTLREWMNPEIGFKPGDTVVYQTALALFGAKLYGSKVKSYVGQSKMVEPLQNTIHSGVKAGAADNDLKGLSAGWWIMITITDKGFEYEFGDDAKKAPGAGYWK
ncbi:MAG: hypothetical protein A3D31_03965 [Candidatus Fluviicola riflensis]|nr:MAG: hypothetical protein CHH17_11065 [Candidatus Fluviicola riflensis]OGS79134.1 MAG: hypothetical protein A3D31_03965 [Candidatus Fluviicola riflensis]OGS86566.1 MAG: hypothetical protein A2724_03425 [Fluviicola sp. RIFCSPHIGHO2_01_FULL_43_53]OGS88960.1 MAG: hypothetical protein A3E30_01235 [Fluviicola sp. RIFCSPHIGHO2_12_FULL_43_24]